MPVLISDLQRFSRWLNFGTSGNTLRDMPDEQSDRIIKLLEEIRDLTRARDDKFEEYVRSTRQRYDEAQKRALLQRRRFLWISTPPILLAIGFMIYLAFWVIPGSEEKQSEQQLQEYRMIQTNYLAQPH
jgi:hypothetical protein